MPLQVIIPDSLIPEPLLNKMSETQVVRLFEECPKGLRKALSRNKASEFLSAGSLDRVEAWLFHHLSGQSDQSSQTPEQTEFYPAWAMCKTCSDAGQEDIQPFTRWWGSVGSITIERDGVSFTPVEALQVTESELNEFWALAWPLLHASGWQSLMPAGIDAGKRESNVLLVSSAPVPMHQASPWSVQNIRLTDYLPMNDECADWRRMWLKLQVELKHAPFNIKREELGQPTLNCLWFWGGGSTIWQPRARLPKLYSVGAEGLYPAVKMTQEGHQALNRLLFWQKILGPFFSDEADFELSKSTLYCVDFQGWGASAKALEVLETEVIQPMQIAGLAFEWVLMGQQGWRSISSNWLGRFKFWKNKPNWTALAEPDLFQGPTEEDLQNAWDAGQRENQRIESDWS